MTQTATPAPATEEAVAAPGDAGLVEKGGGNGMGEGEISGGGGLAGEKKPKPEDVGKDKQVRQPSSMLNHVWAKGIGFLRDAYSYRFHSWSWIAHEESRFLFNILVPHICTICRAHRHTLSCIVGKEVTI